MTDANKPTDPVDVEAIRARVSNSVTEIAANPREYFRIQQILRDRSDLLREVDHLLEGKCRNWPCTLPDGHKLPCSTTDVDDMDDEERDDSPYCDCGAIPSEEEEAFNRCGKRIEL